MGCEGNCCGKCSKPKSSVSLEAIVIEYKDIPDAKSVAKHINQFYECVRHETGIDYELVMDPKKGLYGVPTFHVVEDAKMTQKYKKMGYVIKTEHPNSLVIRKGELNKDSNIFDRYEEVSKDFESYLNSIGKSKSANENEF